MRSSNPMRPLLSMTLVAICLMMVAAPQTAMARKDLPTWNMGDAWDYEENIFITGSAFPEGWLRLTDWQRWSVRYVGNRDTLATSITRDVYDLAIAVGDPAVCATGWYKSGTRMYLSGSRMRNSMSEMWRRRSDLSQVRRQRYITGTLRAITSGSSTSIGNFVLNENWEYNPPMEVYDFPTYVGEIWNCDGGTPGEFLTINTWGTYNAGTYGGTGDWNDVGYLNALGTVWDDNATAPYVGGDGTDYVQVLGTIVSGVTVAADYEFWYSTADKSFRAHRYQNEAYGDFTFRYATVILQTRRFVAAPSLTLAIDPETANVGDSVTLSGTNASGTVTLTQPEIGFSETATPSGGNYSLSITAPYATDPTSTDYDLASIGYIATTGPTTYKVATLTLLGEAMEGLVDDDAPGDQCVFGDRVYWRNFTYTPDLSGCFTGPFPTTASVEVMDMSDSPTGSCTGVAGLATGIKATTAQWIMSETAGTTTS